MTDTLLGIVAPIYENGSLDTNKIKNTVNLRSLDLNFDGYEDLINHQYFYHYGSGVAVYLFDPAQENLVYDRKFSDIAGEFRFRDVELDAGRKRIILNESGESCSSANYFRHREWKVVDNQPELVQEMETDIAYCENGKDTCIKTEIKNFVDGQWQHEISYEPYVEEDMEHEDEGTE
jgi:hypothetical protein